MMIESGPTSDVKTRVLFYLALLLLFAGWFGYDGFVSYPAKNMVWARENLQQYVKGIPEPGQLKANSRATLESLKQIQPGMTLDEVRARLGEPTFTSGQDCCYIGVAAFGSFTVQDGKVVDVRKPQMNSEPTESDIANQRRICYITGVLAVLALLYLVRVLTKKTILDDQGLRIRGKLIPWDAMRSLDTAEYARKGWLNLVHDAGGGTAQVRLDSYEIDLFDEIVTEICRRKNFASPLAPPEADKPE